LHVFHGKSTLRGFSCQQQPTKNKQKFLSIIKSPKKAESKSIQNKFSSF